MKVIAVVGSPRKGNTEWMASKVLEGARAEGAETELILLKEKQIRVCDGCLNCERTGRCHIEDDANVIYEKLKKAEGVLLGSPSYFDNMSGMMKVFLDRSNPHYGKLKNKKFGVISVGQSNKGSISEAVKSMKTFGDIHEMKFVGSVYTLARDSKEAEKKGIDKELMNLGKKLMH